jgi:hypothetical protein
MDPDPDPAVFVIDFQGANKKQSFSAYFFLKVHLHHFSRIKKSKRSHKAVGVKGFLIIFAW